MAETLDALAPFAGVHGGALRMNQLWSELESALRDTEAGRPSAMCLRGAVGMGKGAVADALARLASERGHGVARGRAVRGRPHSAMVEALGLSRVPGDRLSEQRSPRLAPPVRGTGAGRGAERAAWEWLSDEFLATAAAGPLAVIIDGLHDADAATLRALGTLLGRLTHARRRERPAGLFLFLTCKDTCSEPVRSYLREWEALGLCQQRRVPAPSLPEVCEQLRTLAGHVEAPETRPAWCMSREMGESLSASLLRWTGGNRRFLRSLLRELERQGGLSEPEDWVPSHTGVVGLERFVLPRSLTEAIERDVARLLPFARHRLAQAACLGNGCPLDWLAAASGLPVVRVLSQLGEHPHIARVRAGALWFESDLYRRALSDELDPSEQKALHQAVAEFLLTDAEQPSPAPSTAWLITQHLLLAGHLCDRAALARNAPIAGAWLFDIGAYDDAARAYDAAAGAASDRASQALMRYRAGMAHQADRKPSEARVQFQLALSAYQELQDDQGLGMVLAAAPADVPFAGRRRV